MKHFIAIGAILFPLVSAQTSAAVGCGAFTQVTGATLTSLIQGSTVCVGSAGNWQHQEQHRISGNELWDYKKGTDPVDPSDKLGTWAVSTTTVTYTYDGGTAPVYQVWGDGSTDGTTSGNYYFCGAGGGAPAEIAATIIKGAITSCDPP